MSEKPSADRSREYGGRPSLLLHWRRVFGGKVKRIALDPGFVCPHMQKTGGCSYCDPSSFSPVYGDARPVAEQLREGVERGTARGFRMFAAYFQPRTNTHAPLPVLREVWDVATFFPEVVALCVGTRPDCVADPVLDLLSSYSGRFGEIWLELGLQSANDATLTGIGRGHDSACFADAAKRAKSRGLKVCAHVILGLPGETAESEENTATFLRQLDIDGVKLHQLAIIAGTRIEADYLAGKFPTLSEDEYGGRAADFVKLLPEGTVLHRLVGDSLPGSELAPNFDKNRVLENIRKKLG